jgi:fibronectin-binding autotransporter adhesin
MARQRKNRARGAAAARSLSNLTSRASRHSLAPALRRRLRCEPLEYRRLLALITVTIADDSFDEDDGFTSLREAIFAANIVPGDDEIRFDPGLFAGGPRTILLTRGELAITESLTIVGPGTELLTIDASGNDPTPLVDRGDGSRVFTVDDGIVSLTSTLIIHGMSLTGGDVNAAGGAIKTVETLHVRNVRITDNAAQGGGAVSGVLTGGAAIDFVAVELDRSRVNGQGGAALIALSGSASATFTDCWIHNNSSSGDGGGLHLTASGAGNLTILGSRIESNTANEVVARGGGVFAIHSGSGSISLHDNRFLDNTTEGTAADGGGAAIYHLGRGIVEMRGNVFQKNHTNGTSPNGGGAAVGRSGSGNIDVRENAFLENSAGRGRGGGAYLTQTGTGSTFIHRNHFEGNNAASGGGAFVSQDGVGDLDVVANHVSGNTSIATSVHGGGFAVRKTGAGNVTVHDNAFEHNRMAGTSASGIGVYIFAGKDVAATASFNRVLNNIKANERNAFAGLALETAQGGSGQIVNNLVVGNFGGISASGSGVIDVIDNTILSNVSTGLSLTAGRYGVITSRRNMIAENRSPGAGGGLAAYANNGGLITVTDCVIEGNISEYGLGGGVSVYCFSGGSVVLANSTISGNQSAFRLCEGSAGGAYLRNDGGSITLDQCTISGNKAATFGGGIAIRSAIQGNLFVRRSTIASNTADADADGNGTGGGIYVAKGTIELENTILAGNSDGAGLAPDLGFDPQYVDANYFVASWSLLGNNLGSSFAESPLGAPERAGCQWQLGWRAGAWGD